MRIEKIIEFLGNPITNPELIRELSAQGVEDLGSIELQDGEFSAYYEQPEQGFSLVFTDEAMFLGKKEQPIGQGALYWTGIFIYSEGKDGYSEFSETMPFGINFEIDREQLISMIGTPSWSRRRPDGSIAADRWDELVAFRIQVTYSKATLKPTIISLDIPDSDI